MDSGHVYPLPLPPMMARPHGHVDGNHHHHQQPPPAPANNWAGNDANTLLVVATLITTLTYQLGTSIPGGYWQQDTPASGGKVVYRAGDPIMRDLHRPSAGCSWGRAGWGSRAPW